MKSDDTDLEEGTIPIQEKQLTNIKNSAPSSDKNKPKLKQKTPQYLAPVSQPQIIKDSISVIEKDIQKNYLTPVNSPNLFQK
jgi:hypothetical protein